MASHKPPQLEFYYDISCPFAYIASTRIEALATRTSANLIWRPVLLGAIYRETAAPQGAAGSASDVFNPTKKTISAASMRRTLKRYRILYNPPPEHPRKTVDALRLLHYVSDTERPILSSALFRAYWVDRLDVTNREVLLSIASRSGIASASRLTKEAFEDPEARNRLKVATTDAVQRGAPGVPGFWIPDLIWTDSTGAERSGKFYWGQDRMHFVEASLKSLHGRRSLSTVPHLKRLMPRCIQSSKAPVQIKMEFWYDFSSPWAFLGWTQLERIKRTYGNNIEIVMKPFLLGALFKQIGAPMLPMMAVSKQKRSYMNQDLTDWVSFWNAVNEQEGYPDKQIDFHWPTIFPIRSPTVLRCAMVDPSCIPILYRACWEADANVSDESVLAGVLEKAGYQGLELIKKASTLQIKDTLRKYTQEAFDVGICGVPSYRIFRSTPDGSFVGAGGIIWGQDESAVVEDLISGWDEESCTTIANVGEEHLSKDRITSRL